jgi:hypothetical protein
VPKNGQKWAKSAQKRAKSAQNGQKVPKNGQKWVNYEAMTQKPQVPQQGNEMSPNLQTNRSGYFLSLLGQCLEISVHQKLIHP